MEITLLVKKETSKETILDITRDIIIPIVKNMPTDLKMRACIYCQTPTDFGRETQVYMTTDGSRGLTPTYTGEDGSFKYLADLGLWRWGSSNKPLQPTAERRGG